MDLKTVMPGALIPNYTETSIANTAIDNKITAPLTEDKLIIGVTELLNNLSVKTANALSEQNTLLQMLPASIRSSAEHILKQSLPNFQTLSAGLESLLHSRRDSAQSLTELAQKLEWTAALFRSSQAKPAELMIEIKRFHHLVKNILEQINYEKSEMGQTEWQQVGEQIRSAAPNLLRQAATGLSQRPSAAVNFSIPANILRAAEAFNLPDLPQLWLLTDLEFSKLHNNSLPINLDQHASRMAGEESLALPSDTSQTQSAALFNEIKQFAQQIKNVLSQFDFDAKELDPAQLQQAREQIRSAMSDMLQQAAEKFIPPRPGDMGIPLLIRQAADRLGLPELPHLWPLSDNELVALLDETPSSRLVQSAATVRTLSELVNRAFLANSEDQGHAAIFTLQMPFLGESTHPQPVYIHIYHEKGQPQRDDSETKTDTWVRLILEPEHTGPVTAIFHLRGEETLDIKVVFADKQASLLFGESVSSIREACDGFTFKLGDVSII